MKMTTAAKTNKEILQYPKGDVKEHGGGAEAVTSLQDGAGSVEGSD